MVIDFLSNPNIDNFDISSLRRISGGGAPMPAAIAQKLLDLTGLKYMEGYGLSETIGATHTNPLHICKQQCLGIPTFDVDSRIVDPETLQELNCNEVGEIIVNGPQVFKGYWKDQDKTKQSFIELDGKMFFRTGDLGFIDEDGFFFFTDRLKRMINAGGLKVWPNEIESILYKNPAVAECCVIAVKDLYRGETVKALIVARNQINETELINWCRNNMAAYKVPRIIEFVDSLPKSATGKIMWKQLQDKEKL
jgi:fatty-acyl-CoA synthase